MGSVQFFKFFVLFLVVLALQPDIYHCGRWGGGGPPSSSYGWNNPPHSTPSTYPSYPSYYQNSSLYNYNRYQVPSRYPAYYPSSSTPSPSSRYGWINHSTPRYSYWFNTPSPSGSSNSYGWGKPSSTAPPRYPSYPGQPTTPSTYYRNPSPTRYSGFYPGIQSTTSRSSIFGWQARPANSAGYPARSTTPSPLGAKPAGYGWRLGSRSSGGSRSWGGSRPSYSVSRPSYSISRPSPSFSIPSNSWRSTPSHISSPSPSYGWKPSYTSTFNKPSPSSTFGWHPPSSNPSYPSPSSIHRPSPAPAPSYGWNIPSSKPSSPIKPINSFPPSRSPSSPPSYGWNKPSSPSSRPSSPIKPVNSFPPSRSPSPVSPPSYGWNPPSHPSYSPAYNTWNKPSSHPANPSSTWSSSPSKPPAYGGNTGTIVSKASNPWAVPGRDSPYKQNTGVSFQPSAPPSKGTVGWNPSVTSTVNSGVSRNYNPGTQTSNKKVFGSSTTGVNKPYPTQQYGPAYHTYYQPGTRPGTYGYQPPNYYGSGGHTTIINNNNYHASYPSYGTYSYYRPPVYYPSYHYTYHDTGSSALGFYLGYSLGHMNTPTYHYYHHHDSYRPVYDHYTIHYYNHHHESAPRHREIPPNTIKECIGDSGMVCPPNTYALCTDGGSIMCVARATSTVPCTDITQTNCVRSTVPCLNSAAPECKGKSENDKAEVSIPCIYTTKVLGNITYINNTIVLQEPPETKIITVGSSATPTGNATKIDNTTIITPTTPKTDTDITTTHVPSQTSRNKRDANQEHPAQAFCVTIVAQPAERKNLTESELLYEDTKKLFHKFTNKAFRIS